ncbi:hypothetical protein ACW14X_23960 [Nocardioides sp. YJ-D4]
MSSLWTTLIAVLVPVVVVAASGMARYMAPRARALRALDAEIATLNSLPSDSVAYAEMEVVVRRRASEYARAATHSRHWTRAQAKALNRGLLIGLIGTIGGATATSSVAYRVGQDNSAPVYVAALLTFVLCTGFGVVMLTLAVLGAANRAAAVAWAELTSEGHSHVDDAKGEREAQDASS